MSSKRKPKKNKRGLTEMQQRFCDYYIASGNALQSAEKAGYKKPHPQGAENLQKPTIQDYIEKELAKLKSARVMDMLEWQEFITAVARGETKEEHMGIDPETRKAVKIIMKPAIKDRLKAADMIAKTHGAYTTNINLSGEIDTVINIEYIGKKGK